MTMKKMLQARAKRSCLSFFFWMNHLVEELAAWGTAATSAQEQILRRQANEQRTLGIELDHQCKMRKKS
jgi:hypothetical protein